MDVYRNEHYFSRNILFYFTTNRRKYCTIFCAVYFKEFLAFLEGSSMAAPGT
jgi:hypothetical protein